MKLIYWVGGFSQDRSAKQPSFVGLYEAISGNNAAKEKKQAEREKPEDTQEQSDQKKQVDQKKQTEDQEHAIHVLHRYDQKRWPAGKRQSRHDGTIPLFTALTAEELAVGLEQRIQAAADKQHMKLEGKRSQPRKKRKRSPTLPTTPNAAPRIQSRTSSRSSSWPTAAALPWSGTL